MTCTPQDVKDITGSTLDDAAIQPFIDAAGCLIDSAAECAGVSDAQQDKACTFLSAHLLVSSNVGKKSRQIKSQKIEGLYDATYVVNASKGSGVLSTTYGETANMLMGGCLAEMDKAPAGLFAIGSSC